MADPAANTEPDILGMSDQEFMNLNSPPSDDIQPEPEEVTPAQEVESEDTSSGSVSSENEENETESEEASEDADKVVADSDKPKSDEGNQNTEKSTNQKKAEKEPVADTVDFKSFYDTIMKPFKANGKLIAPKSPEEAIQLMQMGANYTRKMQDLVPARKAVMTLENNGLMVNGVLDEGKLSYLIDLDKKNPEAIKRLIKESGFDAMGYDPDDKDGYTPHGNHIVSDSQVVFKAALDDVSSTDEGIKTLQEINANWDQASKDVLFNNPDVVRIINDQRASGIYDKIVDEINHQRTVGGIGQSVPFIQAYRLVGDQMQSRGEFNQQASKEVPATQQPNKQPIAVRAEAPKVQVNNSEQVAAAASTRAQNKSAKVQSNPLALSDEDFMKQMSNR